MLSLQDLAIYIVPIALALILVLYLIYRSRTRVKVQPQKPATGIDTASAKGHVDTQRSADTDTEAAAAEGDTGDSAAVAVDLAEKPGETEDADASSTADVDVIDIDEPQIIIELDEKAAKPTFRERLAKARDGLSAMLAALSGSDANEQTYEELEEILIMADVGVDTTMKLLDRVREKAAETKAKEFDSILAILRTEMEAELSGVDIELKIEGAPAIWMFVGVNGVGKTTTIGKLANREVQDGKKVVLAAGDTFRAAAAEQLETWATRSEAGFIRGAEGADPGSVVFDAVEHGAAVKADLVMADTAGRLHNKANLMAELTKVRRVAEKAEGTVSEVLLVIDATTGQNGLTQAKVFTEAVDVTGVVLTKLDGSAKGGIVLAIQSELGIPVKLVGLGEGIDDLVEFDAAEFVDALFA